ncbi:hypothetical protein N0B44_03855 [Roseibacterium beibuensis]|uniref:Aromatic-amino-acid transaminase n=1 Tax=[Roseibacterium] beibuensis TaxID=1193142 RepID=A0ABP9KYF4_9RHOB|nr:hypothetical protein [Roseibacterium beibuensis]MCS6622043.1 hypothetical protein [Roseibacterium beibuensis]
MFEKIYDCPVDPIMIGAEYFANDPRQDKLNLTVGIYQDERGQTPILHVVNVAFGQKGMIAQAVPIALRGADGRNRAPDHGQSGDRRARAVTPAPAFWSCRSGREGC